MKKLLFVLFFPITIPVYLAIKLFCFVKDSFIPFVKCDVIPFINNRIVPKIKGYAKYKSEQTNENNLEDKVTPLASSQDNAPQQSSISTKSNYDNLIHDMQTTDCSEVLYNEVQNAYTKFINNPPIDYEKYPELESTTLDPVYLRAMAVVAYENTASVMLFQRRLKIGYARASRLIDDLRNKNFITQFENEIYLSNITAENFETWYNKILEYIETDIKFKEKHVFSFDEVDELFKQYSAQYDDIEYNKDSKIVSIFTKKWREICRHEFIVLDFETTGLNYQRDRIIEVAAIKYVDGIEINKMVTLVNPLMHISSDATQVNNITDDMLEDAPTERSVIPQLIEFLGNSLIVGHYVNFDLSFLEVAAQRYGFNVKYNYIDTISVAKKLFKGLPNYQLGTIANSLHIDTGTLHRAEADVRICAEIINIALNSLIDDC